ncbi:o-succinylbenzoate synthase [Actinokineospora auranticolor]|uniref:o-succinylbenzoate synthase n=1 Tax=Actinokineospora auranticolor TaxID=155976 RepID=A0A2S6GHZ2_9PSEU|nr:o-succinylbenzoate synthase [Actinokineospora auranticolor]PPK64839.1 O-succinylbenzoate synthase [Actinokineospora auranticolor]
MPVERITLRFVTTELTRPFENRWQRYHTWTKLVLEVDDGAETGLGECAAMETPFYNYETIDTAWHITERYLAPMVLSAGASTPEEAAAAWAEVDGHEETKGGVEAALWDLRARKANQPLCVALGGAVRPVPVGATAGIEPTVDELLANLDRLRGRGYQRVRVKIRPGWDVEPLRSAVRAFPDLPLLADANAAYPESAVDDLAALDDLGLAGIEQPFPRHLLDTTAALQARIATPICLDEQVHSTHEARRVCLLKAGRMVNIKVGRVGGLAEARKVHDICRDEGVDLLVGGKWDQGVGRWCALALATLPGITLPSDIGPSGDYYLDDAADTKVEFDRPGWVTPRDAPGLGTRLAANARIERELHITA